MTVNFAFGVVDWESVLFEDKTTVSMVMSAIRRGIGCGRIVVSPKTVQAMEIFYYAVEDYAKSVRSDVLPLWTQLANKHVPMKIREQHPDFLAAQQKYQACYAVLDFLLNIPMFDARTGSRIYINP